MTVLVCLTCKRELAKILNPSEIGLTLFRSTEVPCKDCLVSALTRQNVRWLSGEVIVQ